MSEDKFQANCYWWFCQEYPNLRRLLFHVPNQWGTRNQIEGMRLKSMGVTPGISDFVFMYKSRTLLIELKVGKGRQNDNQKKWQQIVSDNGFVYVVVNTLEKFKTIIMQFITYQDQRWIKERPLDEFQYLVTVWSHLMDKVRVDEFIPLQEFCKGSFDKFIEAVQLCVDLQLDQKAGFEIEFNEEFTQLIKRKCPDYERQ